MAGSSRSPRAGKGLSLSKVDAKKNIFIASPRGFCAGVSYAIDIVNLVLEQHGPPVYVRHEIVHNRHVVEDLRKRGARFVDDLAEVPEGALLVFSAHGVSPAVRSEAESRGLDIVDATCPLVTKVHLEAQRFAELGYDILLIGHRGHVEVEGTLGQAPEFMQLVETVDDVAQVSVRDPAKVAIVTQTTLSVDDTRNIVAAVRRRFPDVLTPDKDDICYATQNRQQAVKSLAEDCDLILVIGSPTSSNANRLVEVARGAGTQARLIEAASDIEASWLEGLDSVGVTAGASTPEGLVEEVIERMGTLFRAGATEMKTEPERVTFALPKGLRKADGDAA